MAIRQRVLNYFATAIVDSNIMWFGALSEKKEDDGDSTNTKKKIKPPASLLSSTAAGETSSSLPPLHFSSRRSPIYCTKGCVATSQPLATSIGLHILRGCGGNAADGTLCFMHACILCSYDMFI